VVESDTRKCAAEGLSLLMPNFILWCHNISWSMVNFLCACVRRQLFLWLYD